jgi:DNA polymerase (family 10)
MTNRDLAATLFNIATLLRDRSDNPYRVRAYVNGARALMRRDSDDLASALKLCEGLPPHMGALMRVPGVGPRLAQRLHDTLGISTPAQLMEAARLGRLQAVWGVGPKREAQFAAQLSLFDDSDFAPSQRMAA